MNARAVQALALAGMLGAVPGAERAIATDEPRENRRDAGRNAKVARRDREKFKAEAKRRRKAESRARHRRGAK